ncbi:MAG TPA: hypothetical protein VK719_02350 [Trebonia sp.]|nr:hypothetical protein [Trebonia sp.]
MTVTFNHTIIAAKDRNQSARFFRELLELPEAPSWGVFTNIQLDDGVLLQFAEPRVEIQMQHRDQPRAWRSRGVLQGSRRSRD